MLLRGRKAMGNQLNHFCFPSRWKRWELRLSDPDRFFVVDGTLSIEQQSFLIKERVVTLLREKGFLVEGAIKRKRG